MSAIVCRSMVIMGTGLKSSAFPGTAGSEVGRVCSAVGGWFLHALLALVTAGVTLQHGCHSSQHWVGGPGVPWGDRLIAVGW